MKAYLVYEIYDEALPPYVSGVGKDYESGKKIAQKRIDDLIEDLISDEEIEREDIESIKEMSILKWENENYGFIQTNRIGIPYLPVQMIIEERDIE